MQIPDLHALSSHVSFVNDGLVIQAPGRQWPTKLGIASFPFWALFLLFKDNAA